jgi:glycosyltransferase involved in cell wall biosynthesis
VILGVGPLERHKGFRDAAWTLDILNALHGNLHLVLAGAGPDRPRVEGFARTIGAGGRVRFLGPTADLGPWLERAEVVWVPSLRPGGVGAALGAMAAGRPVVASALPDLAEVVAGGETGFLVPPGDKAELARRTRRLLEDAGLRERLGEAGRRRAEEHFSARRLAEEAGRLYEAG